MRIPALNEPPRRTLDALAEQFGHALEIEHHLAGGDQGGAWLAHTVSGEEVVLKLLVDAVRASRTLRAVPIIARAADGGWPVAQWLHAGMLTDGTVFVLQEYVAGRHVTELDEATSRAIVAANLRQRGLADPDAFDHAAHHDAVLGGESFYKAAVAGHSPAGAALVAHGDQMIKDIGLPLLPRTDVVHGVTAERTC